MRVRVRVAWRCAPEGVVHVIAHFRRQTMNGKSAWEGRVVKIGGTKRESPYFRHGRTRPPEVLQGLLLLAAPRAGRGVNEASFV